MIFRRIAAVYGGYCASFARRHGLTRGIGLVSIPSAKRHGWKPDGIGDDRAHGYGLRRPGSLVVRRRRPGDGGVATGCRDRGLGCRPRPVGRHRGRGRGSRRRGTAGLCGRGSSGLIAQLDRLELPGTFGIPLDRLPLILAGGAEALLALDGGSEDDVDGRCGGGRRQRHRHGRRRGVPVGQRLDTFHGRGGARRLGARRRDGRDRLRGGRAPVRRLPIRDRNSDAAPRSWRARRVSPPARRRNARSTSCRPESR